MAWTLRTDLKHQPIEMAGETFWVLQDSMSRQMQYVSDREYAILCMLDGKRSVDDLISECRHRFAPDHVSGRAIIAFLADARRRQLIVGDAVPPNLSDDDDTSPQHRWWKQPLAIRLPGINPDPVIGPLVDRISWLMRPWFVIGAFLLVVTAGVMAMTEFGALAEQISAAARSQTRSWLFILIGVIAATKIVHELAHAIACTLFGAQCRAIGVMLLVGIPVLYCDVSDAWMLPQRSKRILVSAAGMLAELVLAAIATLVWWFTADGVVQNVCVTVMVVCSLSTIVFNGNPLLRYDGYFILSDFVGIPNLSSQSRLAMRDRLQSLFWGLPQMTDRPHIDGQNPSDARRRFLLGYAAASAMYRMIVYSAIAYMIYRLADGYGLGTILALAFVGLAGTLVAKSIRKISKRPSVPIALRPSRPVLVSVSTIGLLSAVALVPLPHSVVAPAMLHPGAARSMYTTIGGHLVQTVGYGEKVQRGQTIAQLNNPDEIQENARLKAECQRLELELDAMQSQRGLATDAGARIPAIREALQSALRQRELHDRQLQQLNLRAPITGTVFATDTHAGPRPMKDRISDPHDERPLTPNQLGRWVEPGTNMCVIGSPQHRDLVLWVRQQDIPKIRRGQSLTVLLPDQRRGSVTGIITEIAVEPIESVERELLVAGLIELRAGNEHERKPRDTIYHVRAVLDEHVGAIPTRLTTRARIDVSYASLFDRLARWFHDAFRFKT